MLSIIKNSSKDLINIGNTAVNIGNCCTIQILGKNNISNNLLRSDFNEVFISVFLQNYKNSCGVILFVLAY